MTRKLGVRAIVKYDDKLIMVEHKEEKHGSFFIFPGGGIEENESIFDAAVREVKEETSLEITADRIVYMRETKIGDDRGVEFYVLCALVNGDLKLGCDPEKGIQVLKSLVEVKIEELKDKRWFPVELHDWLIQDIKNGFKEFRYLGVCEL